MSDVDAAAAQGCPPPRWVLKAFTRINVCVQQCAPYADYQKRTTRQIPVFLCEPRGDG